MYLEIKGKRALFSRHEFKVERISYEVPTPSAFIGILKSIYWKPEMDYVIEEIHVINKPEFELIMKNGQGTVPDECALEKSFRKSKSPLYNKVSDSSPISENILLDVHYIIRFHIVTTGKDDSIVEKHIGIFLRRAEKGQYYRQPCLGMSEFPCEFNMIRKEDIPKSKLIGKYELGIMLHHIDYSGVFPKAVFYKPVIRDGLIDTNESSSSKGGWLFEELCNFYDNNRSEYNMPMIGYSKEKVTYEAIIGRNCEMVSLKPISVNKKNKAVPVLLNVPEAVKGRTSGIKACFSYDNAKYVFGLDKKNGQEKHSAFIKKIKDVIKKPIQETDILINFLESFSFEKYTEIFNEYKGENGTISVEGNIVFRIEDEEKYIHELPEVQEQWIKYYKDQLPDKFGICGVTGKVEKLTTMHPLIKGVTGSSAFTKLVSVNASKTAFNSYGWKGIENSNFGIEATHKYSSSLNWLLSQPTHRVSVGNSTFVFWTDKNGQYELVWIKFMISGFSGEKPKFSQEIDKEEKLYILELKANSSRLIVGGFKKFKLGDRDFINYCLKASGALKNGNIKRDWDYIFQDRMGDSMNKNRIGYKLGELFAILEKAQRDAVKSTRDTKTIVDMYIEKASSCPSLVFPKLLRNSIHHTNKVDYGIRKKITEKLSELESFDAPFPRKLDEEEKCFFHMGYYKMNDMLYKEVSEKVKKKENENE